MSISPVRDFVLVTYLVLAAALPVVLSMFLSVVFV